jgi:hypothetical protein
MNVGILTMHRVRNWGSFLQAFALKQIVEEFGHKCSFIDIMPCGGVEHLETQRTRRRKQGFGITRDLRWLLRSALTGKFLTTLRCISYRNRFNSRYDNKFLPILGVGKRYDYNGNYDLVIIGSDEIFNIMQPEAPWYRTLHVFGERINARNIVTYAASFGYTTLADLETAGLKEKISQALRHVSTYCVRDLNSYKIMKEITGHAPELCVDPVFIYDYGPHMPKIVPHDDYIIVYSYHGRICNARCVRVIKEYARAHNKKCISLSGYHDWCDQSIIPQTPFELLSYFANADLVITDTFHGTVFSIKYNRNFCVMVSDAKRNKLGHFLQQMELTDRIANSAEEISLRLATPIDYSRTNKILDVEITKAREYLRNVLCL